MPLRESFQPIVPRYNRLPTIKSMVTDMPGCESTPGNTTAFGTNWVSGFRKNFECEIDHQPEAGEYPAQLEPQERFADLFPDTRMQRAISYRGQVKRAEDQAFTSAHVAEDDQERHETRIFVLRLFEDARCETHIRLTNKTTCAAKLILKRTFNV